LKKELEGGDIVNHEIEAINRVRNYALTNTEHQTVVEEFCKPFGIEASTLINRALCNPITLNFHPDRFSNNGKTIIENLMEQGQYHGQFRTGTSNGGLGGNRLSWEQRIFFEAYSKDEIDRPKYGALNIFRYIDGASMRFGSCFFALKHDVISRCTFAYGDSSTNPETLCTSDTFEKILASLFTEYLNSGRALDQVLLHSEKQEVLAMLLNPCEEMKNMGRNLDYCIETHIHGNIHLDEDIESFYVDSSFQNTLIGEQSEQLCKKYGIALFWIPKRQVNIDAIGSLFRGPKIPALAAKIDSIFGKQGFINAELIGQASRDSYLCPEAWEDIGSEPELFQYIKQLWHTVGFFG